MLPVTGGCIATWGSSFFFIIPQILIDIHNNIILHSHDDLLLRKYLHIHNVWILLGCWVETRAHSITYLIDEDHRSGWFQAMNLVQGLWLHMWDDFHCALGSLLKIILIFTIVEYIFWTCKGKMKYFVLNSPPILVLLGGRLTKVQRRKEAWKRLCLTAASVSTWRWCRHLWAEDRFRICMGSVFSMWWLASRGQEARPGRSQLVVSCPWLQEELCPDGMSYPGGLVLLRVTILSTFSSVPVKVHDLMAFFLSQFSNPSLSICCCWSTWKRISGWKSQGV